MNTYRDFQKNFSFIQTQINYTFKNQDLLNLAFIHRSFVNENRKIINCHNERLEFLGDATLDFIVSDFLYSHFPNHSEGELSYLRSRLVEAAACTLYLQKIGIAPFLMVGNGEAMNVGKGRETLLANLFEAIIGAIYLDGGLEAARTFFFSHFQEEVQSILENPNRNWKAELQDYCQKTHKKTPKYAVVKQEGPDHLKIFYVQVELDGKELGIGKGFSKKEGEQAAAQRAMQWIEGKERHD